MDISMYAIVKTGGKQYRVEPGQRLLVERLAAGEGETVALTPLMYRSEEIVCDGGALGEVKVAAKVIAHERGEKLRVFKFKPKRGYKRRTGHRQELTRIEVTEISYGAKRGKAAGEKAAPVAAAKPKAASSRKSAPKDDAAGKAADAEPKPAAKPRAAAKPKATPKPKAEETENGA
jgi:large subunit ribosomal protein L21